MRESFDSLLKQYEDGRLTRRQLLGAITALALPGTAGAQARGPARNPLFDATR